MLLTHCQVVSCTKITVCLSNYRSLKDEQKNKNGIENDSGNSSPIDQLTVDDRNDDSSGKNDNLSNSLMSIRSDISNVNANNLNNLSIIIKM